MTYVRFYKDYSLLIGCDDIALLEAMQGTMDGNKVRMLNQIIVPIRSGPKIFRFDKYADLDNNVKNRILKISSEIKNRKNNIKLIKRDYNKNNINFDYDVKGKYAPLEHQKTIYHAIIKNKIASIIAEAGTCKTAPYLWAIDKRIKDGKIKRSLIITLSHLKDNILEEMDIQTPNLKGINLSGGVSRCDKILNKKFKSKKKNIDYDVYISNYESMFRLKDLFKDNFFQMVILDEAHRIGSPRSRQTKSILDKFENIKYKAIVTGSLVSNNSLSFFMPFRFLGPDTVPEANYYSFRQRFQTPVDPDNRIWVDLSGTKEIVKNIINNISIYFSKEGCIDLPEKIYKKNYYILNSEQKKYYDQIKNDLIVEIENMCANCDLNKTCDKKSCNNEIAIKTALVSVVKLSQICCGFFINTKYEVDINGKEKNISNTITFNDNPKLDLLMNVINDIKHDDKIIIWSNFTNSIKIIKNRIEKAYGKNSCLTVYGDADAYKQVNNFKNDNNKRFFIANPTKASTGLNIQFSNYQIFFSNNYSYIQRDQAESRQHRQGQKNNVTIIDLMSKGRIDEIIFKTLMSKKDLSLNLTSLAKIL